MRYQNETYSCGAASVVNTLRCFGKRVSEREVTSHMPKSFDEHGDAGHGIKNALERLGFNGEDLDEEKEAGAWKALTEGLEGGSPVILCVDKADHWVVAVGMLADRVVVFDSKRTSKNKAENGVHVYTRKQLMRRWSKFEGSISGMIVRKV